MSALDCAVGTVVTVILVAEAEGMEVGVVAPMESSKGCSIDRCGVEAVEEVDGALTGEEAVKAFAAERESTKF